jgi:hypothetical protein
MCILMPKLLVFFDVSFVLPKLIWEGTLNASYALQTLYFLYYSCPLELCIHRTQLTEKVNHSFAQLHMVLHC